MTQVFVQKLAQEVLGRLYRENLKQYRLIEKAIDGLHKDSIRASNTKKLAGTKNIYRRRVGRWRILFTLEGDTIKVWIIAMEKGTKPDYFRWIFYIEKNS